jgi:hypothetical protein
LDLLAMSGNGHARDPVGAAISVVLQPPVVRGATCQITLPTGRPAMLTVPEDVTDLELLGLVTAAVQFGMSLRAKQPSSRILVPQ